MRRRITVLTVMIAVMAIAGVAMPAAASGYDSLTADDTDVESSHGTHAQNKYVQECVTEPPEDYADPEDSTGVIGWTDGYWYNEPLNVNSSDGLNGTEVEKLGARTTARVEAMRCLDASEGTPPIDIITREQYRNESGDVFSDITTKDELYANSQYETMLMIGSDEDYWQVRADNRGETVGAFYNFVEKKIVMINDNPDSVLLEEYVLAQEVGHAVQDQQFNLSRFERPTNDIDKGILSLIEGDMNLIDTRYQEACQEGLWEEPCVSESPDNEGGGGGGELASWGLYLNGFQPYSDGPKFIEGIYEEEGWDAIDAMYENPPKSAMYSVYPERWGEVEVADVTIEDTSADNWRRLTYEDTTDYDTVGIAGIAAMFMAPAYEADQEVWSPQDFLNLTESGEVSSYDPLVYDQPETVGWRGDRLYTYANEMNETGAVWKLKYTDAESLDLFLQSYQQLINVYNGQQVDGYEYTWTFGEDSKFDMALTFVPNGDTVTIVKGPSVDALTEIRDVELVEAEEETPTPTETPTATPTETQTESPTDSPTETEMSTDEPTDTPEDESDGSGPGFGIVAGVLALLAASLIAVRRQ